MVTEVASLDTDESVSSCLMKHGKAYLTPLLIDPAYSELWLNVDPEQIKC